MKTNQLKIFGDNAKAINENDLFLAKVDSVEGRKRVNLNMVDTNKNHMSASDVESDIIHIIQNYSHEMPENLLNGIHTLVDDWLHEKQVNEGLDAFDRRDK